MSTFDHLLTKKSDDPGNPVEEETLYGHTQRVFDIARLLTGALEQRLIDTIDIGSIRRFSKKFYKINRK